MGVETGLPRVSTRETNGAKRNLEGLEDTQFGQTIPDASLNPLSPEGWDKIIIGKLRSALQAENDKPSG